MAASVDQKLRAQTKFPPEFNQKVDMQKVNVEVMKKWIAGKITEILGNEDDVVIELCFALLEGSRYPDIKSLQISLTGFLDKDAPKFCKELWNLCLSAQSNPQGVPKELLEAKKLELLQEKVDAEKAAQVATARRDQEQNREQEMDNIRQRERAERGGDRGRGRGRETPADPLHGDARLLSGVVHATLTPTHRGVMVEAEAAIGGALGPGRYRSLVLAHQLAEPVATGPQADRSLRDLAAHPQDEEEAQIEDQALVTDLHDPLLDQSHHTHEHLEDVATQALHALEAVAEARHVGQDGHTQARDRVQGRNRQIRDGVVGTEVVADEGQHPALLMTELGEGLISCGVALLETTAV